MSTDYNAIAEKIFTGLGFECESEPEWISKGRKPDFLCRGDAAVWVEVKSPDFPEAFSYTWPIMAKVEKAVSKIAGAENYRGYLWAAEEANDADVKFIRQAVKKWLSSPNHDPSESALFVSQNETSSGGFTNFAYRRDGKDIRVYSRSTPSGRYGVPSTRGPDDWLQDVRIVQSGREARDLPVHAFLMADTGYRLALHLEQFDGPFRIALATRAEGAAHVDNLKIIRRMVNDANDQFKNAWNYLKAPALLMIFHSELFSSGPEMFRAALYGDLKVAFPLDPAQEMPTPFFGENGAFGPDKHTTTSAVCYFMGDGPPTIVANPWAACPLPETLLRGIQSFNAQGNRHSETVA